MPTPEPKQWHRQPLVWMLILFPFSAVVGGIVTIWLAVSTDDGLVVDDYYQRGKEINRVLARDEAAARLGLSASVILDDASGRIILTLISGDYTAPHRISLRLLHATRAGHDQHVQLARVTGNRFQAALPALPPGRWYLQIEADDWRLTGSLNLPSQSRVDLTPPA